MHKEIGYDVNVDYGVMGNAASWHGLPGGAEQLVMPLNVYDLEKIGVLSE